MSHARKYTVYDIVTNEALVTGTAMHCAETLGVNDRTIRAIERGEYNSRKYRVTANRPSANEQKLAKVAYSELGAFRCGIWGRGRNDN